MGDRIIQTFCKIGSTQKLGSPSLICRNFKTLSMQNALKSNEWQKFWVHETFEIKIWVIPCQNNSFFWKVYTSPSSNLFKIGSLTLFSDLKRSWKFKLNIFTTSRVMSLWNFTCFCQWSIFASWQFGWNFQRNNWITWEQLNSFSWHFHCVFLT